MAVVTFGLDYVVKPGKEEVFVRDARRIIKNALPHVPGHLETRLFHDETHADQTRSYSVHSEWESKEALEAFTHSKAFASVRSMGKDLLEEPPDHHLFIAIS